METNFNIRPASLKDSEFLAEAIIMSDKGIGEVCSYCGVFGLNYRTAFTLIKAMIEEEIEGCEISTSHFLIAEKDEVPAAAVASWVEGSDGVSSWMIRMALMQEYFPAEALKHSQSIDKIVKKVVVPRTNGTLQIESVYVREQFRGNKLAQKLICQHVASHNDVEIAELMTYVNNKPAISMYSKIGFKEFQKNVCDNPEVLKYYPGEGMLSMHADIKELAIAKNL